MGGPQFMERLRGLKSFFAQMATLDNVMKATDTIRKFASAVDEVAVQVHFVSPTPERPTTDTPAR